MGIGRSAFYDTPEARARDLSIVAEMKTICDEFEAYGYRRVDAELRHRGIVVNAKKIRRLMREHALNPRQRRRFIATTDSDHNYPIFPNRRNLLQAQIIIESWRRHQHDQAARIAWIQAASTGFVSAFAAWPAALRRTGSAGPAGATASLKLTFHLDHSAGTHQSGGAIGRNWP